MKTLKDLTNVELLVMLRELEAIPDGENITIGWIRVPTLMNDDIVSKELELRSDRSTKPIFVINLKKSIKNEMADRFIAELTAQQYDKISLAV